MAGARRRHGECAELAARMVLSNILISHRLYTNSYNSARSQQKTLIVPDKDADGLDAGVILYRTLVALGLDESLLDVHLLAKGNNIHDELERELMKAKRPKYVIVADQGSRSGPPVVDLPDTKCLIIDHHLSDDFPESTMVDFPHYWSFLLSANVLRSCQLVTIHQ